MAKKILPPKEEAIEDYLPMVNDLIDKLRMKPEWTEQDEVKLKKLDKLLGIMSKIAMLEKKYGKKLGKMTSKADVALVKKYLARKDKKDVRKN